MEGGMKEKVEGQVEKQRIVLTPREYETLHHLARGCRTDDIATFMYIANSTVKTHIKSIYRKLGVGEHEGSGDRIARARAVFLAISPDSPYEIVPEKQVSGRKKGW